MTDTATRGRFQTSALRGWWRPAALGLLLTAATLAAYGDFRDFEFVNFDDKQYVTENPYVRSGLTFESARWALTATDCFNWHPLTWLSHMLDVELYDLAAPWHHRTSLGLHVLSTLLLFSAFLRMTGEIGRSALVAGLFALHPLHVESVAWIAERKDVLSGLCFAGALQLWAGYAKRPSALRYVFAATAFAAGLAAKPMLVTLPAVLLLLDVWPLGRLRVAPALDSRRLGELAFEKLPLFALSAAACAITLVAQRGAISLGARYTFGDRSANALVSYARYLGSTVFPAELSVGYAHPAAWPPLVVLACLLLLASITAATLRGRATAPWFVVGWLWFLGMLVPTIGLIQVGEQAMADRYMYLPSIGLFVMAAWGIPALLPEFRGRARALQIGAAVTLLIFGALTRSQVAHWRNSIALWEHARAVDPQNSLAWEMLGLLAQRQERYVEALEMYQRAVELDPRRQNPNLNFGNLLMWVGRTEDALVPLREAVRLRPDFASAHESLGHAYRRLGEVELSVQSFQRAVEAAPSSETAQYNLGNLLMWVDRPAEAIVPLREAVRLRPDFALAYESLGHVYRDLREMDLSLQSFQRSVELDPGVESAQYNLGIAYLQSGRPRDALAPLSEAVRLRPERAVTLADLAAAHDAVGDRAAALEAAGRALRLAREQGEPKIEIEVEEHLGPLRDALIR